MKNLIHYPWIWWHGSPVHSTVKSFKPDGKRVTEEYLLSSPSDLRIRHRQVDQVNPELWISVTVKHQVLKSSSSRNRETLNMSQLTLRQNPSPGKWSSNHSLATTSSSPHAEAVVWTWCKFQFYLKSTVSSEADRTFRTLEKNIQDSRLYFTLIKMDVSSGSLTASAKQRKEPKSYTNLNFKQQRTRSPLSPGVPHSPLSPWKTDKASYWGPWRRNILDHFPNQIPCVCDFKETVYLGIDLIKFLQK